MRRRMLLLLAALALLLVAASSAARAGGSWPAAAEASGQASTGSIAPAPERPDASLSAVEPGRAAVLARSEGRQTSWVAAAALLVLGLVAAAPVDRHGRGLRRLLELTIRSRAQWWSPALGGRAPPSAAALR